MRQGNLSRICLRDNFLSKHNWWSAFQSKRKEYERNSVCLEFGIKCDNFAVCTLFSMDFEKISECCRNICQESIIGTNMQIIHDAIAPEFKELLTISEIGKRLALADEKSGGFKRIGNITKPTPSMEQPQYFEVRVSLFTETNNEWLAVFSINQECKINNLFFCHPSYIAANYFNPHKVLSQDINEKPLMKFYKPAMRKTSKIPMAILVQAILVFDIDGHMYSRYPWKDFEFLAQKKIGLIKTDGRTSDSTNAIVDIAINEVKKASELKETSKIFLLIHSFAALFLPEILKNTHIPIGGIILLNPAWEPIGGPQSGNPSMTADKVPKDIPMLIIGSGNDQFLTQCHYDLWNKAAPQAEAKWYEKVDHFMMDCNDIPTDDSYMSEEGHVNEKILRDIVAWIKKQDPVQ